MTNYDRSKLARIVAFNLHLGREASTIESYLLSYAPSLTQQDIDRAFVEGRAGREIALELSRPGGGEAALAMRLEEETGAIAFMGAISFGLQGSTERRSMTLNVAAGTTVQQALAAAADQAQKFADEALNRDWTPVPGILAPSVAPGSIEFTFMVPLFAEG